jgi:elongation factor 1-beta
MSDLVIRLKVLPSDAAVPPLALAEAIRQSLPADTHLLSTTEEPIAFGLVAVIADVVVPEGDGVTDRLEAAIRRVPTSGEVEVLGVSRRAAKLR